MYLHGSSSCRLEVKSVLEHLLRYDVTVFCFDFSGSGMSEGDYVSLGYHEEQDLRDVLNHLRSSPLVSSVALWGWSMGAVTAVLRAAQDSSLAACVLDSPFANLRQLGHELVGSVLPSMPHMVIDTAFTSICDEARSRAGFDLDQVKPSAAAMHARVPALFAVAKDDTLTPPWHTEKLHKDWAGEKSICIFEGEHTTRRPAWFFKKAAEFLWDHLKDKSGGAIDDKRPQECFLVFPVDPDGHTCQRLWKKVVNNACREVIEAGRPMCYAEEKKLTWWL